MLKYNLLPSLKTFVRPDSEPLKIFENKRDSLVIVVAVQWNMVQVKKTALIIHYKDT